MTAQQCSGVSARSVAPDYLASNFERDRFLSWAFLNPVSKSRVAQWLSCSGVVQELYRTYGQKFRERVAAGFGDDSTELSTPLSASASP